MHLKHSQICGQKPESFGNSDTELSVRKGHGTYNL